MSGQRWGSEVLSKDFCGCCAPRRSLGEEKAAGCTVTNVAVSDDSCVNVVEGEDEEGGAWK